MSHSNETWGDGWVAMQQALLKSMFPMTNPVGVEPRETKPLLQEQFADLQETWKESIEKWSALVKDGSTPSAFTPQALREMFAPARWSGGGTGAFDIGLQQVIEGPRYATLWDLDRKLVELQQLAMKRDKATGAFQAVVQRGWNTAFERFTKDLSSATRQSPSTWRGMTDRWLAVANETLIEVHRSAEFVEAQTRMLRATSDYRLQERAMAEAWCEACHIPTRTEVDEMQRTVTELRRQLRLLQRKSVHQVKAADEPVDSLRGRRAALKSGPTH